VCETWPTTKEDEEKIAILERRIYKSKTNNKTGQYEIKNNAEVR